MDRSCVPRDGSPVEALRVAALPTVVRPHLKGRRGKSEGRIGNSLRLLKHFVVSEQQPLAPSFRHHRVGPADRGTTSGRRLEATLDVDWAWISREGVTLNLHFPFGVYVMKNASVPGQVELRSLCESDMTSRRIVERRS